MLTEGDVSAGDEIVKLAAGPDGVTVAEIDALLYLPGHDRARAAVAAAIPALSPGWRVSLHALADRRAGVQPGNPGLSQAGGPPPAGPGFRPLSLTRIDTESVDVRSLHLGSPDGEALPSPRPGQFVTIRVRPGGERGPLLVRNYSLSGPTGAGTYRIRVKHEANGAASSYLHTDVEIGVNLEVTAPRGAFILDDETGPVVLLSAGVGATPMAAMLHALVGIRSHRQVWWLHAARDGAHHSFAREVRDLLARLPDAHSLISYSQPGAADHEGADYTMTGRLTSEALSTAGLPAAANVYLCGPPTFMSDLTKSLSAIGIDPARVRREIFGAVPASSPGIVHVKPAGPRASAQAGAGPLVSFARTGLSVNWDPSYANLLDLADAFDVPIRWSCRTGVCHTCETALLAGAVTYSPTPLDAPADGNALVCCARPVTEVVLDL